MQSLDSTPVVSQCTHSVHVLVHGEAVEVFTVVAGTGQTTMWPDPLHMQLIRNVMSDHTYQRLLSGVTFCSVHAITHVSVHMCVNKEQNDIRYWLNTEMTLLASSSPSWVTTCLQYMHLLHCIVLHNIQYSCSCTHSTTSCVCLCKVAGLYIHVMYFQ